MIKQWSEEALKRIHFATRRRFTEIDLSGTYLVRLPDDLAELEKFTSLDISGNKFTELPAAICRLTQLTSLNISGNQLTSLPVAIGQLTQLTALDIRGNYFTGLPDSIGKLTQLHSLDIGGHHLTRLPRTINQLKQLYLLNIGDNQLTELPESFGQLTHLISLCVSGNQLTALPESIGLLERLISLRCSDNRLDRLTEAVGQLGRLYSLDISNNQLTDLPRSITRLEKLNSLNIGGNLFSELPVTIGRLKKLRSLDVGNNQLTVLPEFIGQLGQLVKLNIAGNQLTELPESVFALRGLTGSQALRGNRLNNPPQAIANWGWQGVFEYRGIRRDTLNRCQKLLIRVFNPPGIDRKIRPAAIAQTLLVCLIALAMLAADFGATFWVLVAVSPLFMLRTEISMRHGLRWFGSLLAILKLKQRWRQDSLRMNFYMLVAGAGALLTRAAAAVRFAGPNLYLVLQNIPDNFSYYFARCSFLDLPEFLPGMDKNYAHDVDNCLSLYDFGYDFSENTESDGAESNRHQSLTSACIAVFFVVTLSFRVLAKAAAIFYLVPVYIFLQCRLDSAAVEKKPTIPTVMYLVKGLLLMFMTLLIMAPELTDFSSLVEKIDFVHRPMTENTIAPIVASVFEICLRPKIVGLQFMLLPLSIAWLFMLMPLISRYIAVHSIMGKTSHQFFKLFDRACVPLFGMYIVLVGVGLIGLAI